MQVKTVVSLCAPTAPGVSPKGLAKQTQHYLCARFDLPHFALPRCLVSAGEILLKRRYSSNTFFEPETEMNLECSSLANRYGARRDQFSDPIIFEVDAVQFDSERSYFAKSIEL